MSTTIHRTALVALAVCAVIGAGCGSYVREQGNGPTQATVAMLEAAPGAEPNKFGGTLASDVLTNVKKNVNGQITIVPGILSRSMIFLSANAATMFTAWPELCPSPCPGAPATNASRYATPAR